MIVVSDTSCITNLIAIQQADLMPALFGEVIVPPAVQTELLRTHASLPDFLRLQAPHDSRFVERVSAELDEGEAQAIALAKELKADRLLIDEKAGRAVALREGIPVIGVLGMLLLAKQRGLIASVGDCIGRLENEAGFHLDLQLKRSVLRDAGEES